MIRISKTLLKQSIVSSINDVTGINKMQTDQRIPIRSTYKRVTCID